jgi:uncharacterized protein YlxW (UPF0749 family)
VEKRLARGQYRTLPPETIEGDIAALVKSVTALHVERDRLKAEKENDAWHRGWKVAVAERDEARDLQRRAEAEAARLRAALETLKALIEKWQKEADEYASDSAYNAAIHCANELEHALKAALDSSGTVPGKTGGA